MTSRSPAVDATTPLRHPRRVDHGVPWREVLLLAGSVWALVYAGLTLRSFLTNTPGPTQLSLGELSEMAAWRGLLAGLGVLLCAALHAVYRALPPKSLVGRAPWMVLAGVCSGVIYAGANYVVFYLVASDWGRHNPALRVVAASSIEVIWIFIAWVGLYLALTHGAELRDRERRLAESEALTLRAQFQMLRYQLSPHFLFNALNSLSTLILDGRAADAEAMVMKLAAFLRYTLDKDAVPQVRLREELDAQRLYLEVEQIRFGDRLQVDIRVEPQACEALMPSLLLQPIVENCIKHALARQSRALRLEIAAARVGDRLLITVLDDGPGSTEPEDASGLGLRNVRSRLGALHGSSGSVEAGNRPGGGYAVSLQFPCVYA